ncbi:phosphoglycerate mutase-like protein [Vararia minispora EC-137]|uniref:Phosphoglycerate mutase-like protein n=1 Tax=Vararia minispora EC-137 TaxID=1314806 RepID=A0ACB8QUR2_9AGAM|nr:phosphoglycerate mutase-like protein [Vararia minispora EC-137]
MSHPTVRGVVVLTRNGDHFGYAQNPYNYQSSHTECTPLGEVQAYELGQLLRDKYFTTSSPSYIKNIDPDLVDLDQVQIRIKNGGEGRVVFDSTIALLQGLFPPSKKNSIELANETLVVAPLGGYQYVPAETVEPSNDRSLESWTDCPNFEKHTKEFYSSDDFKAAERHASRFFAAANDFLFGHPAGLVNAYNVYDFMNHQLTHNKSYAHRLPPTFIEQARHWANFHEQGVFSDKQMAGIGNIAARTLMQAVISSLQRITYDGDPVQFILHSTTYQPFISLFNMTEIPKEDPSIYGIPDYASALAIELRRGSLPDNRDFLRFMYKNGTGDFLPVHVFDHKGDVPLTEFIYRVESSVIANSKQWASTCGTVPPITLDGTDVTVQVTSAVAHCAVLAVILLLFSTLFSFVRHRRQSSKRIRLPATAQESLQHAPEKPRV